jgi:very-short-patch-repair endonuclease
LTPFPKPPRVQGMLDRGNYTKLPLIKGGKGVVKYMKIYYNPKLKYLARKLRKNSTLSEILLWEKLKGGQMMGYQFMRQKPIYEYIVDFYCSKLKLIIEIDGDTHDYKFEKDNIREKKLKNLGLHILRFNDIEIKVDIDNVLNGIEGWIEEHEEQPPNPLC